MTKAYLIAQPGIQRAIPAAELHSLVCLGRKAKGVLRIGSGHVSFPKEKSYACKTESKCFGMSGMKGNDKR